MVIHPPSKYGFPEFIFWICGTNDLDWYNDRYHEALRKTPTWHPDMFPNSGPSTRYKKNHSNWNERIQVDDITKHDSPKDVIDKLHDITKPHIDATVYKINFKIKNCKNFAMEIVPRMNWYPDVIKSACGISAYMRKNHNMTLTRVKTHILPVHYMRDHVHYTKDGYRVILDKAIGPLLDVHYTSIRVPKCDRVSKRPPLTKNGRKRAAKRAKLALEQDS